MPAENEFYDHIPDHTQFYQGDVLRDVPYPSWAVESPSNLQERWSILRPLRTGKLPARPGGALQLPTQLEARANSDVVDSFSSGEEWVLGKCTYRPVLVVSRACQIDNTRRKHVLVAPLKAIAELPEVERGEGKLRELRNGGIPHNFYLPAHGALQESFANLLMITPVHRSFLNNADVGRQVLARLSSASMSRLQQSLSAHFGQAFGFDHTNTVPQAAAYRCMSCFQSGREVPMMEKQEGELFGACDGCGTAAAFVKVTRAH